MLGLSGCVAVPLPAALSTPQYVQPNGRDGQHPQTVLFQHCFLRQGVAVVCHHSIHLPNCVREDWSWLGRTADNRLTLTTCVTGKPDKRFLVQAVQG